MQEKKCGTCCHWDGTHKADHALCGVILSGKRSISAQSAKDGGAAFVFVREDFGCVYWEDKEAD